MIPPPQRFVTCIQIKFKQSRKMADVLIVTESSCCCSVHQLLTKEGAQNKRCMQGPAQMYVSGRLSRWVGGG